MALLRHTPDHHWSVEELARRVALSSSQLTRLFRAQLGISSAAFLGQVRTEKMAELLGGTSVSVGEAARSAGWANATVASRAFKRRYGVSPRSYAVAHDGDKFIHLAS